VHPSISITEDRPTTKIGYNEYIYACYVPGHPNQNHQVKVYILVISHSTGNVIAHPLRAETEDHIGGTI